MNTSFNAEHDTKLADLVYANPVLYGKELRCNPYETMKKKMELWKSIAVSLDSDAKYCITRWKGMRDRFRRERQRLKETGSKTSSWALYEKLKFLTSHIKYNNGPQNRKVSTPNHIASFNVMDAENLIEEVYDDDPLQEAMDEQTYIERESNYTVSTAVTSTTSNQVTQPIGSYKRIEVLLAGIDDVNRTKAERRIVAYLCHCQLKSLNNEDIDDVTI